MDVSDSSSRILAGLLEARTGQQLTISRRWRIETALKGLMRNRKIETLDQLIARLVAGEEPALADEIVEALLNNETYFYRDRAPFELLLNGALRSFERSRATTRRINIWCAGCSTGQEVYSLAMSFAEDMVRWREWKIDIIGTDVSRSAIEKARSGLYTQFEVQRGLPVVQMMRWFTEEPGNQWRLSDQLRNSVRFQVHGLGEVPPFPGRFDIILCRNVLLYFNAERRKAVFGKLASAIADDGCLMLGAAETVIGATDLFTPNAEFRGLYVPARTEAREDRGTAAAPRLAGGLR